MHSYKCSSVPTEQHVGKLNTAHTYNCCSSWLCSLQLSASFAQDCLPFHTPVLRGQMLGQKLTCFSSLCLPTAHHNHLFPQFPGTPSSQLLALLTRCGRIGLTSCIWHPPCDLSLLFGKCERWGVGNCIDRQKEVAHRLGLN